MFYSSSFQFWESEFEGCASWGGGRLLRYLLSGSNPRYPVFFFLPGDVWSQRYSCSKSHCIQVKSYQKSSYITLIEIWQVADTWQDVSCVMRLRIGPQASYGARTGSVSSLGFVCVQLMQTGGARHAAPMRTAPLHDTWQKSWKIEFVMSCVMYA